MSDENSISGALRVVRPAEGAGDRSDDDLMLLTRGGVDNAFDELVRRHQRRALNIALKQIGSIDAARDVVQNTFVELYKYVPRYRPEGKLSVLLYRILLNQIRLSHRRWKRSRLELVTPPERVIEPEAEELVLRAERDREVQRAIAKLSRPYRDVVTLRFGGELSYAEVADVLGVPVGTVKSRIFAAMKKLRVDLREVEL